MSLESTIQQPLIKKVSTAPDLERCLTIRNIVFVQGQKVPINEEIDGKDAESDHYLLMVQHKAIGTARVRYSEDVAKIERVAILEEYQGQGFGRAIMQAILSDVTAHQRCRIATLGAQTYAIPFYEKLGFSVCSDVYLDAGIPHKDMVRPITQG